MGAGVDAVKSEIMYQFDAIFLAEHFDVDSTSTDIGFSAEGRNFVVRVSTEFDQDYEAGLHVDLEQLGLILRASKDGKVTVRTSGISQGILI
jgi:hypothetical protein